MTEKLFYTGQSPDRNVLAEVLCPAARDEESDYEAVLDQELHFSRKAAVRHADTGATWTRIKGVWMSMENRRADLPLAAIGATGSGKDRVPVRSTGTERFARMQQHSGEHIVSGIVHARFGYDNVGFHLNDELCTLDFEWTAHEGGASRGGKYGK